MVRVRLLTLSMLWFIFSSQSAQGSIFNAISEYVWGKHHATAASSVESGFVTNSALPEVGAAVTEVQVGPDAAVNIANSGDQLAGATSLTPAVHEPAGNDVGSLVTMDGPGLEVKSTDTSSNYGDRVSKFIGANKTAVIAACGLLATIGVIYAGYKRWKTVDQLNDDLGKKNVYLPANKAEAKANFKWYKTYHSSTPYQLAQKTSEGTLQAIISSAKNGAVFFEGSETLLPALQVATVVTGEVKASIISSIGAAITDLNENFIIQLSNQMALDRGFFTYFVIGSLFQKTNYNFGVAELLLATLKAGETGLVEDMELAPSESATFILYSNAVFDLPKINAKRAAFINAVISRTPSCNLFAKKRAGVYFDAVVAKARLIVLKNKVEAYESPVERAEREAVLAESEAANRTRIMQARGKKQAADAVNTGVT